MTQAPPPPPYVPPAVPPAPRPRRRWWLPLLIVLLLLFVGGGLIAAVVSFLRSPGVHVEPGTWLVVRLAGDFPEERPGGEGDWADILQPDVLSAQDLNTALWRAVDDDRIAGVLLRPDGYAGGWAQAQEIRQAAQALRQAGKPVWAYVTSATPGAYYVASVADAIALPPEGRLFILGLRARLEFLRGTLDMLGAEADFVAIGEYKSAPEQMTRTEPSDRNREQVNAFLDDVYDTWVEAIAQGRSLPRPAVEERVARSHFPAEEAVGAGLADHVFDLHQLYAHLGLDVEDPKVVGPLSYLSAGYSPPGLDRSQRLALVYATGEIRPGASGTGSFSGPIMGSSTTIERLRDAREDEDVRAVVLRVDSPGGSVLASDLIWREVERLRQEKPVVVSMGNYAASGGYYVSMSGDRIFANPLTLTGSIGVYMGKVNLRGLYDKVGFNVEVIKRGKNADFFSELQSYTPEQRTELTAALDRFYGRFLQRVADGRSLTPEEVDAVARGRVWSGARAQQASLVDSLGTLRDAIREAKRLAGIDPDQRVLVTTYHRPLTFFQRLARSLLTDSAAARSLLSGSTVHHPWADLLRRADSLASTLDGTPQFRLPWNLSIE